MAVATTRGRRIPSQEEVKRNALDDFCDLVGAVACRFGIELHDGWIHPLVALAGAGCPDY